MPRQANFDQTSDFPLLPHLRRDRIEPPYLAAPGREVSSGKMANPESSSCLVANAFGLFFDRPELLPPLPQFPSAGWQVLQVCPEKEIRFPWRGGRHPWLDVFITTDTHIIGIESKRYEPYRGAHSAEFSEAFWRDVWDPAMRPFLDVRDKLRAGTTDFSAIDAAQLVKHGLALSAKSKRRGFQKVPVLVYLYADPIRWPDGKDVSLAKRAAHRAAINRFASAVDGAQVHFVGVTYQALCRTWANSASVEVNHHVQALRTAFAIES